MDLTQIKPGRGSRKDARRVGRGPGSGSGKTSGRGHKGQKARSGGSVPAGFEGGQMPMQRRLPKRGFKNPFPTEYEIVNLKDLERLQAETTITPEILISSGLVQGTKGGIKILAQGEIGRAITVKVHAISAAAREKITAAGGTVEVL